MHLTQLQRPLQRAAASSCRGFSTALRPTMTTTSMTTLEDRFANLRIASPMAANAAVEGRRYATVKSQGAYKLKNKKTIPKKLGAKKTGDQYVLPGHIIYKQRGTIWHPGENTIMGRDHTIHAAVAGYVKYYRDPARHPKRQYIGVVFDREDKLPYPPGEPRKRKLNLVAVPRRDPQAPTNNLSPSGIPLSVTRHANPEQVTAEATEATTETAPPSAEKPPSKYDQPVPLKDGNSVVAKLVQEKLRTREIAQARKEAQELEEQKKLEERKATRVFHLQEDYSYREYNWEIGRIVGDAGVVPGTEKSESRKAKFRLRRRKRMVTFMGLKKRALARAARRERFNQRMQEKRAKELEQKLQAAAALKAAKAAKAAEAKKSPGHKAAGILRDSEASYQLATQKWARTGYQLTLSISNNTQSTAGEHQRIVTPSLSGLSLNQGRLPSDETLSRITPTGNVEDEASARLSALRALEGVREESEEDIDNGCADVNAGDESRPLIMCGKRKYSDWMGYVDGARRRISGGGALFPEGYQPRIGEPEPWICPVRDCQTIFPEVWALGGHFSALHRGALLNDNQDGTMSVVGKRTVPDPVSGRMAPIVVSRKPINPATAPPKATPRRPGRRKKIVTFTQGRHAGKGKEIDRTGEPQQAPSLSDTTNPDHASSNLVSVQIPNPDENHTKDQQPLTPVSLSETSPPEEKIRNFPLFQHLLTYAPHDALLSASSHVGELLSLDRRRELPQQWRFQLSRSGGPPTVKMVCAAFLFLTGVRTTPPCGTCANLNDGSAHDAEKEAAAAGAVPPPFPYCVRLPEGVSDRLKEFFGEGVCCNEFCKVAGGGKESGVCQDNTQARFVPIETPDGPEARSSLGQEDTPDNNTDTDRDSGTSILFSPATTTTGSSPAYKIAVPVQQRIAGRPRVVAIRRASNTNGTGGTSSARGANTKTKRHSSIRRLAAKLGPKTARREVVVYKPREKAVSECAELDETQAEGSATPTEEATAATATTSDWAAGTLGRRRSRRLRELQLQLSSQAETQVVSSKTTSPGKSRVSPSKVSKLRSTVKTGRDGGGAKSSTTTGSHAAGDLLGGVQGDPVAVPAMPLTLAEWEIAPGRIRMGTGEDAQNVAFSSAYLAQGRAVLADGVTFQTVELPPGESLRWAPERSGTRICSVARGVLVVKLPESEFRIASNGVWKVKQGMECSVSNPFMVSAMIHVTAMEDVF
ncbi:hypothetical protein VTJ49DRAFT_1412 [Mycothermus thermophilus]|uniref:Large ribosomal subunit protein bL27m n=1 Tax=Humicola insolens TaxID=85995 RepID=A0ABR3VCI4_HUMIN